MIIREFYPKLTLLIATDTSGCSNSDTVVVTEPPLPNPNIIPKIFCDGDSITLSLNGFSEVLWTTGDSGPTITVRISDTIAAAVVDSFGCVGSLDTTFVRALPLPQPVIQWDMGIPITGSFQRYQWYWYDSTDGSLEPIPTATGRSLRGIDYEEDPNYTGLLVVKVNDGLCDGFSAPFSLATVGIPSADHVFQIYPQPASGSFRLQLPPHIDTRAHVSIIDLQGKVIRDFGFMQCIDCQDFDILVEPGIYFLTIEQVGSRWARKIIFSKKE